MKAKQMLVLSAFAAAAIMMVGCGGGGGGESVSDCDRLPQWTGKSVPMQSPEEVQNAMALLYASASLYEKLYDLDRADTLSVEIEGRSVMEEAAVELSVLSPAQMVKRLSVPLPTERAPNHVEDENCSISGTRSVKCESGEDATGYHEECTYTYNRCVEYESCLKSLFREYVGPITLGEICKPTNRRYTIDGKLIKKEYEGSDDSREWRGYRVEADGFTVEMEDNESLDSGKLSATIYAQLEESRDSGMVRLYQLEENSYLKRYEFTGDGCLSLYVNRDDKNGSVKKVADIKLQAVDFNVTTDRVVMYDESEDRSEKKVINVNGYAGLTGYVNSGDLDYSTDLNGSDLGAFALYGKGFRFTALESGLDINATVTGTLATPCLGGAVAYDGEMKVYRKYESQDGNDSALPFDGKVTLHGQKDATVSFRLDDENRTYAEVLVDDVNRTYGSWEALIEGNCTELSEKLKSIFSRFYK